jgi:heat shock protein HslJ
MMRLRWMLPAMALAACAPDPAPVPAPPEAQPPLAETPWERSRLAGYAFRGVGQEPGWTVEVAPGREIRAVLDYGERTLSAPAPTASREGGWTVHHARAEGAELRVAIAEVPCADAMSGERMTHTVVLRVDGTEYRGCGRDLAAAGADRGPEGEWRLVELEGRPALTHPDGRAPHLRFDPAEARAGGNTGCNSFGGRYTLEDGRIRFGELIMTRAACADSALNEQERRFTAALEAADRVEVDGGMLSLLRGDTVLARFEAME